MRCKMMCAAAVAVMLLRVPCALYGAEPAVLEGFEFVDRDYGELFYMLSLYSGISISADDTVQGRATFRCTGQDFESAFDSFLSSRRLYVTKQDGSWTVSRVRFLPQDEDGRWVLDASDIAASRLVEKLSVFFGTEISYDSLPELSVTVHAEGASARDFVLALVRQLGSAYELSESGGYLRISHTAQQQSRSAFAFSASRSCSVRLNPSDGTYSLDVENVPVSEVIEKLFALSQMQFVFAGELTETVRRIAVTGASFEQVLALLGAEYGVAVAVTDGVQYVFCEPERIASASDGNKEWRLYKLSFLSAASASSLIASRFGKTETVMLPEQRQFLCRAVPDMHSQIETFLRDIDVAPGLHSVSLQYITVQELLSHLPQPLSQSAFSKTTQDTVCFFTGTDAEYALLLDTLESIDCPAKRLRYDVLIVQYQNTEDFSWDNNIGIDRITMGDRNDMSAVLGSVLGFNLDVVSAFGLSFASSLQSAIDRNHASVFADTTLHGISGGTISFKNTNTYRYRDNNIDPETGKPVYTGVTREIVSGLRLEVTGWISGDGMITSSITASVSRQGADLSSKTGNPPPTSEKIITTQVRGKSGEPIVLTGLVQNEESSAEQGVPLLSQIPGLGLLFKSKSRTTEHTELVIYLVPHWEKDEGKTEEALPDYSAESIIRRFFLDGRKEETYGK